MTTCLSLLVAGILSHLAPSSYKIVEVPVPGASETVVEAIITAPDLSNREMVAWRAIGASLLDGTAEFTRAELLAYGGQSGAPPRVITMPDHIRIMVSAPANGGAGVAAELVGGIVCRPSLEDSTLDSALAGIRDSALSPWSQALNPFDFDVTKVDAKLVRLVYQKYFRPENMTIVVSLPAGMPSAVPEVAERFGKWKPERPRAFSTDSAPKPFSKRTEAVTTIELRSLPFLPTESKFMARILATFAIGVGKDSTLFRVIREQMGWSYRQESILWPTVRGMQTRTIVAYRSTERDSARPTELRAFIKADIDMWDAAQLSRCTAMLRAAISRGSEVSPFWPDGQSPAQPGPFAETLWAGTFAMMGAPVPRRQDFQAAAEAVTLDLVKAEAMKIVDESSITWIRGEEPAGSSLARNQSQ